MAATFNSTREREEKTAKKKKKNNILNIYIYNPFFSFSTFLVLMSCPCFSNIFCAPCNLKIAATEKSFAQLQFTLPKIKNPSLFPQTLKTPMLINIANLNIVKTNRFFSGLYIINILNLDSTFYPPF